MKRGIDVSTFQGEINWAKVKADGIDFAMIKATQGRSETASYRDFTDSKFVQNIVGAHRCGIRVGVYHYLTAKTILETNLEAEYFISVIEPYKSIIDLYAAVDVESKYLPTDKDLLTNIVNTFCSRLQKDGYDPIIYTNPNFLTNRLSDVSAYPLWLALWRDKSNAPSTKQYPNLRIWQWGGEAVDGVFGNVDSDFMIAEKPVKQKETAKTSVQKQDNTPAAWARDAVQWCVDNKILLGGENGDLMLHQSMTREQACLVAKRIYCKAVEDAAQSVEEK